MTRPTTRLTVQGTGRIDRTKPVRVHCDSLEAEVKVSPRSNGRYRVTIGARHFDVVVRRDREIDWGWVDGQVYRWPRDTDRGKQSPGVADGPITAPMPATIATVAVQPGQRVRRGDTVVVLDAMKIEIPLKATSDGRVSAVYCRAGDQIEAETPLVELEPDQPPDG